MVSQGSPDWQLCSSKGHVNHRPLLISWILAYSHWLNHRWIMVAFWLDISGIIHHYTITVTQFICIILDYCIIYIEYNCIEVVDASNHVRRLASNDWRCRHLLQRPALAGGGVWLHLRGRGASSDEKDPWSTGAFCVTHWGERSIFQVVPASKTRKHANLSYVFCVSCVFWFGF